ncbi:phosphomannomutase/phosphoglucomutase [Arenimonas sp. GDDSR-1]|uniref:phosphomannomutase/phosphoglucomutase n=1 Tax=Arenimonas sp. GDDSR-1 TaxID=2950125 RepID=UPI0026075B03|nr:phosphomannomutase/phosphoglucomutase [Arenimonas sp. GDDSR-1]
MSATHSRIEHLRGWVQKHPLQTATLLFVLLSLWFAYKGVDLYSQNKDERDIITARDNASAAVTARSNALIRRMIMAQKKVEPVTAATGEAAIITTFQDAFKNAESVQVYTPGLSSAYGDVVQFGAGRLALLEAATNDAQVAIRFIQVSGSRRLGLAKSVGTDTEMRLVYVQLPMGAMDGILDVTEEKHSYLGLRQGQIDVLSHGDSGLASTAEINAVSIAKTPWRVVASAPLAEKGLFEAGGIGELVLAVALFLLAAGCWFAPVYLRRRNSAPSDADPDAEGADMTLEQMRQAGVLAAQTPPPPEFNIKESAQPKVPLERSIFRAYDIRGIIGVNLDPGIACKVGEAVGTILVEKGLRGIVVGYDGRLSSPGMADGLCEGLASTGIEVINIGQVPTPVVYFAANTGEFSSGISVTGSHNPPDYNGLKIVIDGHTLSGDAIMDIFTRIIDKKIIRADKPGNIRKQDVIPSYIERIAEDVHIEQPLKVVVDCGNGVPGAVAPQLLRAIGAEVEELYCEVDGTFPNHHPDPSDPENLLDLIDMVKHGGADLGLAFDGDGDRLGVVTKSGEVIYADRLLMLFAEDVLSRNPGAAILYDVKCTGALQGHILRNGGSPLMWKTGHSLIKAKMKETHAELAGEMSGHFFFSERWYGFDDGIYAAARLLEILAAAPDGVQAKFDELPKLVSTPELKVEVTEGEQHAFIARFVEQARFEGARISLIDGVRADWPDGWGLVRASNTTPVLVLRFEANDEAGLVRIQDAFRTQLLALTPDLKLPF